MRRLICPALLMALVAVAGCGDDDDAGASSVTLLTHDSFAVSDGILEEFTAETGIEVEVLRAGDAGSTVNQAILTKDDPVADVLYGIDNTFLGRALDEELFVPYLAEGKDQLLPELQPSTSAVTPIDYGDVCVNSDLDWFDAEGRTPPTTFDELAEPDVAPLVVVQNPATSSPGLAFLLATVARFGDGWEAWWERAVANGLKVVDSWEQAYNVEFTRYGGDRPLVVSYASSPPAEVLFSDPQPTEAPTGVLTDTCFRQVEYAGILRGTDHEQEARQLIDFLVSSTFQEDMPLNMFVFPALADAVLPDVFARFAVLPDDPLSLPPERIDAEREALIDTWTSIVLG